MECPFYINLCASNSIANFARTQTTTFGIRCTHFFGGVLTTIQPTTVCARMISPCVLAVADIYLSPIGCSRCTCRKKRKREGHSNDPKCRFHIKYLKSNDACSVYHHFPTQKFLKMVPSTSSVVTSPPVISAKWWRHSRKSCATKSPESPVCKP